MAGSKYHQAIYDLIDNKEKAYAAYRKLLDSSKDGITFSESGSGSIVCQIKYKGYEVAIELTENEVFRYALNNNVSAEEAIKAIIEAKVLAELSK